MNIKKLLKKLDMYKNINKCNIDKNEIILENNKDIIEDGDFISSEIANYINSELLYKYKINYKYKKRNIKVSFFSKKKHKNIKYLLSVIINRIIFVMDITGIYKDVNMYIYDTHFKKKLPCKHFNKCKKNVSVDNINTGYNWGNNIVIYRREELLKLIIHEMIHLLDIDVKYEISNIKSEFLKSLCIESEDVLINESYVETWAIILHMYISLLEQNKYSYKNYKSYFNKTLLFNFKQVLKILIFYNIDNFNDIFKVEKRCKKIFELKKNLFSYHILKLLNLMNINDFINKFDENENKTICKSTYNMDKYIKYLEPRLKKMSNIINKKIRLFKKDKYNLSLKMSLN